MAGVLVSVPVEQRPAEDVIVPRAAEQPIQGQVVEADENVRPRSAVGQELHLLGSDG